MNLREIRIEALNQCCPDTESLSTLDPIDAYSAGIEVALDAYEEALKHHFYQFLHLIEDTGL